MNAVFVYADGKVGEMQLPGGLRPFWRIPRRLPVAAFVEPLPNVASYTYDEYTHRGKMFDGRPVFCAEGFKVEEAWMETLVSFAAMASDEFIDSTLESNVSKFVKRSYPDAIGLDIERGTRPWTAIEQAKGYPQQGITNRYIRVLVACCAK